MSGSRALPSSPPIFATGARHLKARARTRAGAWGEIASVAVGGIEDPLSPCDIAWRLVGGPIGRDRATSGFRDEGTRFPADQTPFRRAKSHSQRPHPHAEKRRQHAAGLDDAVSAKSARVHDGAGRQIPQTGQARNRISIMFEGASSGTTTIDTGPIRRMQFATTASRYLRLSKRRTRNHGSCTSIPLLHTLLPFQKRNTRTRTFLLGMTTPLGWKQISVTSPRIWRSAPPGPH